MSNEIFTVSEINKFIKDVINAGFPQTLWVCGELQQYNRNKFKSHVFFDLVEKKKGSSEILSKVGLVIFANRKMQIEHILQKSENAFELKDDIEVKFACKIDYYAPHGAMRLIVESIDPTYTLGKLAQERQKLIKKLKDNGTFELNKKHTIPQVPLKIGLITSDDSAAYNDFIHELSSSPYGYKVLLRNTLMQGKAAEDDIVKAIKELQDVKNLDVLVITRGGGSLSDLSCFDSEKIAMAIAQCKKPVLTGIGHEINISIADMTAHTFAKTPTALARMLVSQIDDFVALINDCQNRLIEGAQERISSQRQLLRDDVYMIKDKTIGYLKKHNDQIINFKQILRTRPVLNVRQRRQDLTQRSNELKRTIKLAFENANTELKHLKKSVEILHPKNTIKRGFSITRGADGKALKSKSKVQAGDLITTEVVDGIVESRVT